MIIDAHAHVYPDKIAEKATSGVQNFYNISMAHHVGSVDALLEAGKKAGVERFVICSVATTPEQVPIIDHFIGDTCRKHAGTFAGLGALHPNSPDPEADIALLQQEGLQGAKLHPDFQKFNIDDPNMYPTYALLESAKLTLLIHTGDHRYTYSHPSRLARVLENFPKLKVIAAHMGGWSVWDEAMAHLPATNCFVDTSSTLGFVDPKLASEMVNAYGAERILFGVDFPMWDHTDELERLHKLGLSFEQLDMILHKNAESLFIF